MPNQLSSIAHHLRLLHWAFEFPHAGPFVTTPRSIFQIYRQIVCIFSLCQGVVCRGGRSQDHLMFRDVLSHRLFTYISCLSSGPSFNSFLRVSGFPSYRLPINRVYVTNDTFNPTWYVFVVFAHCSCHQDRGSECWGHRGVCSPKSKLRILVNSSPTTGLCRIRREHARQLRSRHTRWG